MVSARDDALDRNELRKILQQLLESQKLAVLATQSGGQPYCNLVAFAVTSDLRYAVFATPKSSQKYENMARDGRVSMLVDNATGQDADFQEAVAATVVGHAEEIPKTDGNHLLELYLQKHPKLSEFVHSPDSALMRVSVDVYIVVRNFQEVTEIRPY
jgi:nitroimidazol reductase NimA-like FMN-containing flavoprotein (pyridoxamine 5'-phosphate oxidase superfamily)